MGRTDAQRAKRYRDRKRGGPPRQLEPCPSVAAYRRHGRKGGEGWAACTDPAGCREAWSKRQHDLYENRKAKTPTEENNP
jgi:hypothetical protein